MLYDIVGSGQATGQAARPQPALLSPLLASLTMLLEGPEGRRHRDALLELVLTLPARSSPTLI